MTRPDLRADSGVMIVELIIYIVVSALFLGLLALMLINGIRAQAQTTERDLATGTSGFVSNSLLTSIRNAQSFTVVDDGTGLIAKVASGGSGWECRAWALTGGGLRYASSAGALSTSDASTWAVIAPGATGTLAAGAAFASDGSRGLTIGLRIVNGEADISVSNGVTAQAVSDGTDTTSCW